MELNISKNTYTGGVCCTFTHNSKHYYADKSYVIGIGQETMIFECDSNGEVSDWDELYCDRTNKSLEECVEEFISK